MIEEQVLFKQENNTHNKDIEILKQHFPNCFDKNGNFLSEKFDEILKRSNTQTTKEYYYLNWLGKSYARVLRDLPPKTLITEDKTHNEKEENKNSKNLLIKGDNLEVLKHLKNAYSQKIKMIYIDPPYNTGSDGFVYQDDHKFSAEELNKLAGIDIEEAQRVLSFTNKKSNSHSAWLTFMYPRLYIARELLKDDGVIFINIDDNEMANLKLLCDEIFGEENFVASIIWQKKKGGSQDSDTFAKEHEYIICYQKINFEIYDEIVSHNEKDFSKIINGKKAKILKLEKWGAGALMTDTPSLYYSIKDPNGDDFFPIAPNGEKGRWRKKPENLNNDHIYWQENSKGRLTPYEVIYFDEVDTKIIKTRTIFTEYGTTTDATKEILKLFDNRKIFDTPKPTKLIKHLLQISTNPNDIILDFFAGSGTTAHAVMKLNAEDGGNRKFILVQLDEEIDYKKSKTAYDFVKNELNSPKPSIFDIAKERIIRASKKIKEEHKNLSMQDFGFKIYQTCENFCLKIEDIALDEAVLPLFDNFDEEKYQTLLTSWRLYDGEQLTSEIREIKLANYTAYLCSKNLYLLYPDFESKNIISLIKMLDEDKDFSPNRVIFYGENIDSSKQKELNQALESYANKKNLTINLLARY